jgi:prepilin-type processing-associated H-X9-DG protein
MATPTDGAFFQSGSQGVTFSEISDGLSNTIMVGEKHIPSGSFGVGWWDSSIYNGNYTPPTCRTAGPGSPLETDITDRDEGSIWRFGSYHPGVCQFVFCDGSVHTLPVTIAVDVLGNLACRNDGCTIPEF